MEVIAQCGLCEDTQKFITSAAKFDLAGQAIFAALDETPPGATNFEWIKENLRIAVSGNFDWGKSECPNSADSHHMIVLACLQI